MAAWLVVQDRPRDDVGTVEAGQPQVSVGRIKAVMPVLAVGTKSQARGARLVVQLHGDGHLERPLGQAASPTGTATGRQSPGPGRRP